MLYLSEQVLTTYDEADYNDCDDTSDNKTNHNSYSFLNVKRCLFFISVTKVSITF